MSEFTDLQLAIARDWASVQGLKALPSLDVHPDDEMLATLRDGSGRSSSHLLLDYLQSGFDARLAVESVLEATGQTWSGLDSFCEFACGFGRLTRHLVTLMDPERIWGCEIQADASAHVASAFGIHTVPAALDPGDLEFPRDFELIYVGSLFSHLPRPRFEAWLKKLFEALTPSGALIFTTHGDRIEPSIPKHDSGFTFVPASESERLEPQEYGSSFVSPELVREIAASCGIEHVRSALCNLWWKQDVHVATPHSASGLEAWSGLSNLKGSITLWEVDESAHARAAGWTCVPEDQPSAESVHLHLDGARVAEAILGTSELQWLQGPENPAFRYTEWFLEGALPDLREGPHTIAVAARTPRGFELCCDVLAFEYEAGRAFRWGDSSA